MPSEHLCDDDPAPNPVHPGVLDIAVWAESDGSDPTTVDVSGSENWIDGKTVSRGDIIIGGSDNQFLHGVEYGDDLDLAGSDNCFLPDHAQVANASGSERPSLNHF